ncbi:geranylgeranyl transferase type-2 subunit alpha [Purpureocillium lavendulum]|uniref:Geranylgeranyl transferase type-2 subunit alpha n=1 Tax=Purpureocillium lavendulum TaxID=1247861 RepID=A0AB34FSB8_9HYPO|nr:geranylgeranyl transferase type-2 subunit alpha [Purpureocillium lavendulum]
MASWPYPELQAQCALRPNWPAFVRAPNLKGAWKLFACASCSTVPPAAANMTSHGVARTAIRPRTDEQLEQDLLKISKYRNLEDGFRQRVNDCLFDHGTFQLTSQLLRLNPEYYTVWNVRRRCMNSSILSASASSSVSSDLSTSVSAPADAYPSRTETPAGAPEGLASSDGEAIRAELSFTVPLLIQFPKCYWIWKYRLWVLSQATDRLPVGAARAIWEDELGLIAKMLRKDRRNFHAWGYRRHVVTQLESPTLQGRSMVEPEFEYTTTMISEDLSNFSAWHSRSQLIPRLLKERQASDDARRAFLETELRNVNEGLNVGPEDQSLWYYHEFLVSNVAETRDAGTIAPNLSLDDRRSHLVAEIDNIRELLEDYADMKRIYDALIDYTVALGRMDDRKLHDDEKADVAEWLEKLRLLDPKRKGRWNDLAQELGLCDG